MTAFFRPTVTAALAAACIHTTFAADESRNFDWQLAQAAGTPARVAPPAANAGTAPRVSGNNPSATANSAGVTVRDPAASSGTAAGVPGPGSAAGTPPVTGMPPASGTSAGAAGATSSGSVTVHDPAATNATGNAGSTSGTLDPPAGNHVGRNPIDRNPVGTTGAAPGRLDPSTNRNIGAEDPSFAADLQRCEALTLAEKSACRADAKKRHGQM